MPVESSRALRIVTPEASPVSNPVQVGIEWLAERGMGEEVAGMIMVGPLKGCDGTFAAMMGIEKGHEEFRKNIQKVVDRAVKSERDPGEAVTASMEAFVMRDENDEIMRVSPEDLKKNREASGGW